MNIAFLVERPTQFEAPFYRFAARDPEHELRVLFTAPDLADAVFDPELGRSISWGIDLLGGYPYEVCPAWGQAGWLAERLERTDLLIVNGYTRRTYLLAALLARRAGVPAALRLDSVAWSGSLAAKRWLYALFLRRIYSLFFAVGGRTLEFLREVGVPPERAAVFSYTVDVEHFREESGRADRAAVRGRLGVPDGAKVVLSLAKFNDREAPWDLLRAFQRLGQDNVWLVLAGDGPARGELERAAGPRVRFPGYVPYPELPALYAAADLFVHPAREERWGVSVQEALACGLPVIASSRVGAAADLIEPGGNGFPYEAGDEAGLAARIGEALALPPARVREASGHILSRWDYAAMWSNILEAASRVRRSS
jgi:glycosyltransferase involved in cell wall biosynthesis